MKSKSICQIVKIVTKQQPFTLIKHCRVHSLSDNFYTYMYLFEWYFILFSFIFLNHLSMIHRVSIFVIFPRTKATGIVGGQCYILLDSSVNFNSWTSSVTNFGSVYREFFKTTSIKSVNKLINQSIKLCCHTFLFTGRWGV